ncbi:MAG: hypothetical protein PHT84_06050 [Candidatus Pacebacteria bacterium]|nr:hypothetical protein [Candidatus Paceibacterota bacterium]
MNEWGSIVKGIYPAFFWLAVLGIIFRITAKKWNKFDTVSAILLLVFSLGVIVQPIIFYGELVTSRRYLLIAVPIYFAWAAEGLLWLKQKLLMEKQYRRIGILLFCGLAAFLLYDAYAPLIKRLTSSKKNFERHAILQSADFIRKDWKGADLLNVEIAKCDIYQSGKRPVVQSVFEQIGYLSGGQANHPVFQAHGIRPDYIVVSDNCTEFSGFRLVKTVSVGGKKCDIWKSHMTGDPQ